MGASLSQWQLHDVYLALAFQCLSRSLAAGEGGGEVMLVVLFLVSLFV